jgi:tRNA-binding protein
MRTATIVEVSSNERAHSPSYQVTLDCGSLGMKSSRAKITARYSYKELIGKQVIVVANFPPKQIANMMSECLILGVIGEADGVSLFTTLSSVQNGLRIA